MRYVIAIFIPWLTFFTIGKVGRGFLCLLLQLTIIGWLPATIWAIASVGGYNSDKRTNRIVDAINAGSQPPPLPDPRRI
jgi:uncharacterized membrane protein YqaE (UPF0057 family)